MKIYNSTNKITDVLLHCLREVPAVREVRSPADTTPSGAGPLLEVETDRGTHRLLIEAVDNGQPRYAREALARLLIRAGQVPGNNYPVFAAPFIAESSAEICRQMGAGSVDLAGNCRLAFDGIFLERRGLPNRFVSGRAVRSLYQARSSRVLRALLFDPALKWKLRDLGEAAGVSIGQVFNVKKGLLDREWAEWGEGGLRLLRPERVLRDWGDHYAYDRNALYGYSALRPAEETETLLARLFSGQGIRYAVTSFSAWARLAPSAGHHRVFVTVDAAGRAAVERAAARLKLEPVAGGPPGAGGADVTLMIPHDEGVFFGMREIGGVHTVSPVQAYLDLSGLRSAGRAAAEDLLVRVIRREWSPQAA